MRSGLLLFLAASTMLVICLSCEKNTHSNLVPDVNAGNDVILTISSYSTIFNLLIKARLDTAVQGTGHAVIDGANISYDSIKKQYHFDFNGEPSPDSVTRVGDIYVDLSGDILQEGTTAAVIFNDYFEDHGIVTGNDSISNQGIDNQGQMVFSNIIRYGYMVKYYGPGTILANLTNQYKTEASSLSGNLNNITFYISGSLSGSTSRGYAFNASIRGTLEDSFSCPWIEGGIIDVEVPQAAVPAGFIDFVSADGCSDTLYYTFGTSLFKVLKKKLWLKN